jgi:hypothetical protein
MSSTSLTSNRFVRKYRTGRAALGLLVMAVVPQLYSMSMWRSSLAFVALLISVPMVEAQDHPKVSLRLPPGIASETVQIHYFLRGPFGGYGGFVRAEREKASYDIEPFVDGQPAENVKIIAYLRGCEIATLDLTFAGAPIEQWLDCYPLGSVSLRGQLLLASTTRIQSREIDVDYSAMWAYRFFWIFDGPETIIHLGRVRPDRDGNFEIAIPDFYQQPSLREGSIRFILREAKTGNTIAVLKPTETTPDSPDGLILQASYPMVQLIPDEPLRQPMR